MTRRYRQQLPDFVAPNSAEAFEDTRADWEAAKDNRFRRRRVGNAPTGSGADYHYRNDAQYLKMMELARDMARNDSIIGSAIEKAVNSTIQSGITPDPQTGDNDTDAFLRTMWREWSEDADAVDLAGESTFLELEEMSFRQMLTDGDIFAVPTDPGQLEMIEGHRVRTPMRGGTRNTKLNVVHGVLLGKDRKRKQIWVTIDEIPPHKPVKLVGEMNKIDVREAGTGDRKVFQIYNPKRVSQTRGVTALAPIIDILSIFEDLQFANLVKAKMVSCFAIFHEWDVETPPIPDDGTAQQTGPRTTEPQADGSLRTMEGISPGMNIDGRPGEKLKGFSPNVPNAEYFPHAKMLVAMVGTNLGLPYIMMMLDASDTNFSGWRGAMDLARQGFRRNQRCLVNRFHRPCWKWKVRQALRDSQTLRDMAKAAKDVYRHCWNAPQWPYIDPFKDAKADVLRLDNRLVSPRRQTAERGGGEYSELMREFVEDRSLLITMAKATARDLNEDAGPDEVVHWRDIAAMPIVRNEEPTDREERSADDDDDKKN